MILTDREIKIAISRRLIEIDSVPDAEAAFSSTAVDLTLDARIRIIKPAEPGVLKIIS